jgi:hypothetical protein
MLPYLASSGTIVAMASVAAVDEGESDKEVADHFFFNTSIFLGCCARGVPPPSILYWRVRAVFAFYGNRICKECGAKEASRGDADKGHEIYLRCHRTWFAMFAGMLKKSASYLPN